MTDVYEIEQNYFYSGSYNNDIKIIPTVVDARYNETVALGVYDSLFHTFAGTMALGLTNSYFGYTTGKNMVLGKYNGTLNNFQNNTYINANVSSYGEIYNFIKKNYKSAPKRNIKIFSQNEIFMDSIMPDPEEIYISGTVDQTRNIPIIIKKPSYHYITASYMMLSYMIKTSSFTYVDYNGDPLSSPTLAIDPHSDQAYLGNYIWPYQFPFENTYKNVNRNKIKFFETKKLESALMYFDGLTYPGAVLATDVSSEPGILSYFKINLPSVGFKEITNMSLGIAYAGIDDSNKLTGDLQEDEKVLTPVPVTKSFYSVVDIKTRTGTSLVIDKNDWVAPNKNCLLFHFYSFGDFLGKFANGLQTTIPGAANGAGGSLIRSWNYPGFAYVMDNPSDSSSYDKYRYNLKTGSLIGYDCRGYKYGIHKPIPDSPHCIWRVNKFGNPRDMLEQRLYTNFYSNGKIIGSVVNADFSSTSSYAITASNITLNPRDSGIYDKEFKVGQPFFDDDTRI